MAAAQDRTDQATRVVAVARGDERADLAVVNGSVFAAHTREWLDADVLVADGLVAAIVPRRDGAGPTPYTPTDAARVIDADGAPVVPGFVDAHVHIESSKTTPRRFAELVLARGTTAVIAEPHEIANVLGIRGVEWMLEACEKLPLDVRFMVPSCVPASEFESAGAAIGLDQMEQLLEHPRMLGVGELMNFPGVVQGDSEMLRRVQAEGSRHVDGHAPGVAGRSLDAYIAAGITSDHESTTAAEAREKLRRGMWLLLREASNARNLRDLLPLVHELGPAWCAFCTDDREPDDLLREGHLDHMCRMAVAAGVSPEDALLMATLHPATAHGLRDIGAICPGRVASLVVLDDLERFRARVVVARGEVVVEHGTLCWHTPGAADGPPSDVLDTVRAAPVTASDLQPHANAEVVDSTGHADVRVIGVLDGQLLTEHLVESVEVREGIVVPDPDRDIALLAVVDRHRASGRIGRALARGFGLHDGAIASSVAHDAHNLVAAGMDASSMAACIERLRVIGGGICVARHGTVLAELPLPVAGLMTDEPVADTVERIDALHRAVRELGSTLEAPFMALSFVALSVIPSLKLTDLGLVDVDRFELVPLAVARPSTVPIRPAHR